MRKFIHLFVVVLFLLTITGGQSNQPVTSQLLDPVDIYEIRNVRNELVNITMDPQSSDLDLLVMDISFSKAVLYAILGDNDQENAHILQRSENLELDPEIIKFTPAVDTIYVVVYSLEGLAGNTYSMNYDLDSNFTLNAIDLGSNDLLAYSKTGTISENQDEYLDANEYTFYEFNLESNDVLDINIDLTNTEEALLVVVLFDGTSAQELFDAAEGLVKARNTGQPVPEEIYAYSFANSSDGLSGYLSYYTEESMTANLGIVSLFPNNPNTINYELGMSIRGTQHDGYESLTSLNTITIVAIMIMALLAGGLVRHSYIRRKEMLTKANLLYRRVLSSPHTVPAPGVPGYRHPAEFISKPQSFTQPSPSPPPQSAPQSEPKSGHDEPSKNGVDIQKPNFCEYCGNKLKPSSNFCNRCGRKIGE